MEEASNDSDSKMKESDLLEGISEEELDVSDDEKDKVKVADALGVDWSQLITPKEVKENKVAGKEQFLIFEHFCTVGHGLLYLLDMKEKTEVCIMGSMSESLYPYKTYSENIDFDKK